MWVLKKVKVNVTISVFSHRFCFVCSLFAQKLATSKPFQVCEIRSPRKGNCNHWEIYVSLRMMIKPLQEHDADCSSEVQILQKTVPTGTHKLSAFRMYFTCLFIVYLQFPVFLLFQTYLVGTTYLIWALCSLRFMFSLKIYPILFMELYSLFSLHHIYLFET